MYVGDTAKHSFSHPFAYFIGTSAASIFFHRFTVTVYFPIHLAGDPLDVKAWNWYHGHVGQGRCRVVDAWWQTG